MADSAARVSATSAHSCAWIASSDSFSTQSTAACSPTAPTMCGVPASNRAGGSRIGRLLECDLVDHRSAALPRRHRGEQLGAAPQAADAGRTVELVRGESVEVGADRGDVDGHARHRLAAVEQQQRALRVGDLGGAPGVEDRTQDVRHVGEGDDAMLVGQHRFGGVEVDLAVAGQRHRIDFVTGELPGDDVAVMLELGEEDAVAAVLRQRARDEVDRLGRAAGEDELVGLAADQPRGGGARDAS